MQSLLKSVRYLVVLTVAMLACISARAGVAHYEYDTFGNTVISEGGMQGDFRYRFSTKSFEIETGFYYYGRRHYDPVNGRWLGRDPMAEGGGLNLYGFVGNDALNGVDYLGMVNLLDVAKSTVGTMVDYHVNAVDKSLRAIADFGDDTGVTRFAEGYAIDFALGTVEAGAYLAKEIAIEAYENGPIGATERVIWKLIQPCIENPPACAHALGKSLAYKICLLRNGDARAWGSIVPEILTLPAAAVKGLKLLKSLKGLPGFKKTLPDGVGKPYGDDFVANGKTVEEIRANNKVGGSENCFVAGTEVVRESGSTAIEDLRVGDRVWSMTSDKSQSSESAVDESTWKKLTLEMKSRSTDDHLDLVLLRSPEWIAAFEAKKGAQIHLVLDEMGIDGMATVTKVEDCPKLDSQQGRVVLGTVTHFNHDVYKLSFENGEVLEVTGQHKLYSASRDGWVEVEKLESGEFLRTRSGELKVESLEKLDGVHRVFNIEVEGEHCYFVSKDEVLSHNNCPGTSSAPNRTPLKTGDYFEHTIDTPKGPVDILADVVADGDTLTLKDISIFGRGDGPLEGLTKEVFKGKTEIFDQAREMGFKKIRILGERIEGSTSANPGKIIDITKDL